MVAAVLDRTPSAVQAVGRAAPPQVRRERIAAVDAARAVAIIGMLVVNSGSAGLGGAADEVWTVAHGRASLLFMLLAGVGVSLMARGGEPHGRATVAGLLWRAGVLLVLGVPLAFLDHGARVILPTYAVLFVLAVGAVRVPSRVLAWTTGLWALLGPMVFLLSQRAEGVPYDRKAVELGKDLPEVLDRLVVSGAYPLVTWAAPFLLGLLIGRLDLRARRTHRLLAGVGTLTAAVAVGLARLLEALLGVPTPAPGFDHLVVTTAHSQMPLWLIGGTAAGAAILGLALMVEHRMAGWWRPLVVTGQLALTIYVGHLVALHVLPQRPDLSLGPVDLPFAVVLAVGAVAFAVLWRTWFRVGPLEAFMRPPWRAGGFGWR